MKLIAKNPDSLRQGRTDDAQAAPIEPRDLYASHIGFVWRNLLRMGVLEEQAEDAAQDVFLVVHRRWQSYDARWSSVETWLFGILLRVASGYRRANTRRVKRIDPHADVAQALNQSSPRQNGPDEQLIQRQSAQRLLQLLSELNPKKRAILVLVDIEEMSVPEAAQALGVNVNTAYWRLGKARTEFEQALANSNAVAADPKREAACSGK